MVVLLGNLLHDKKMGDFIMETLAPGLGVFIALAMFASPVFAVLKVMKTGILGVCGAWRWQHLVIGGAATDVRLITLTPTGPQPAALPPRDGQLCR